MSREVQMTREVQMKADMKAGMPAALHGAKSI